MLKRFGADRFKMLEQYSPDLLTNYTDQVDRCYFGSAPTFYDINIAYGPNTAAMWFTAQLNDMNNVSGAGRKMDDQQMQWTSTALAKRLGHCKITEAMLFFWRFRTQQYEKFYGAVDPDIILRSANAFLDERAEAITRHENEERQRELEAADANAITYEDWLRAGNPPIPGFVNPPGIVDQSKDEKQSKH